MAKTLLTGATRFLGSHVAHLLHERGDDLRLGVEDGSDDELIRDLDAERVVCDVLDRRAVRRALKGVDRVFHVAGITSVRPSDRERLFTVNVGGTKTVLEECLRAGVDRVVYSSSAAAVGHAEPGRTADEEQLFTVGRLGIPYVNSVHEAEVEAMRMAARGLPLVCVNPAVCFGAGDIHLASTRLVRSFLLGRLPLYTEGAICVVDVRDAAEGHLLADQRGKPAERYILGGRNFTFDRLFADLGRMSGVEPPVKIPVALARFASGTLGVGRGPLTAAEVQAAGHWWTYRSNKAKRELRWKPRPHEETLEATVSWHLDREHDRIARTRRSQQLQYRVAGAAIGAMEGAAGLAGQVLRGMPRPGLARLEGGRS
jgi:dihydroflavonol-4-reductase